MDELMNVFCYPVGYPLAAYGRLPVLGISRNESRKASSATMRNAMAVTSTSSHPIRLKATKEQHPLGCRSFPV
jgi:hypothetical protein